MSETVLQVENLSKRYEAEGSAVLKKNRKYIQAVDQISFEIGKGETLGLVGESGCGKSTAGRMIVGIEKPDGGKVTFLDHDIGSMSAKQLAPIRTQLQMIFQDSYSSLNPRKRVYDILSKPMLYHHLADQSNVQQKVRDLLDMVGLPEDAAYRYPHEFSGGQRQRISIARALSLQPKLIVCDEPVSALDVSIQAQILNLLRRIQKETGVSYLFIAHGLGAVHYVSDRIAVMYLGRIVEIGTSQDVFHHALHPYSVGLIDAVPVADPDQRMSDDKIMAGEVDAAQDAGIGCKFAPRCPFAKKMCFEKVPEMKDYGNGHQAACFKVEGVLK